MQRQNSNFLNFNSFGNTSGTSEDGFSLPGGAATCGTDFGSAEHCSNEARCVSLRKSERVFECILKKLQQRRWWLTAELLVAIQDRITWRRTSVDIISCLENLDPQNDAAKESPLRDPKNMDLGNVTRDLLQFTFYPNATDENLNETFGSGADKDEPAPKETKADELEEILFNPRGATSRRQTIQNYPSYPQDDFLWSNERMLKVLRLLQTALKNPASFICWNKKMPPFHMLVPFQIRPSPSHDMSGNLIFIY